MAIFRKIHTSFWSDPFTQDLTPEQKYFYLYLITNDRTKQCGIYEITKRQICYDTGYNIDTVSKFLDFFINREKIRYNFETNEIAIKNWAKYNGSTSPKVISCVNEELMQIKDTVLIEYIYGIDRVSILHRKENKKENKNENENNTESPAPEKSIINSNFNRQPNVPTKQQVWETFKGSGGTKEMAKSFFDKHEGTGWFLNGSSITNFIPLANKFIDNWKRNEQSKNPKTENVKIKLK